ncbi:hypothetical protein [Methylocystis sp.]|uniref:hypothetical protein n=1 Tax=Methylocystis sp. TaxID=1911079 RepID=UPI0025FEB4F8|nr:hypothetical protein [Methylocystis sp.]
MSSAIINDEARRLAELLFPDNPNATDLLFRDSPRPSAPRGADALDVLIDIGWNCESGMPLDESQMHFLAGLSRNLLHGLNTTNASAPNIFRDALGLGQRSGGGGAADQWRRRQRDRRSAYLVLMALVHDPKLTLNEAIEVTAVHSSIHRDTVRSAIEEIKRSYGVTGGLRRPRKGRPKKRLD